MVPLAAGASVAIVFTSGDLAVAASVLVAVLTAVMAVLGWRSYAATRNVRLVFVVLAFLVFVMKSLFVAYNVKAHAVPHDSIEFVSALIDLIIVMLLFTPFVIRSGTS